MKRLGQCEDADDERVTVVGWRCLVCGSRVSERVGWGKVSDMVDEEPEVTARAE